MCQSGTHIEGHLRHEEAVPDPANRQSRPLLLTVLHFIFLFPEATQLLGVVVETLHEDVVGRQGRECPGLAPHEVEDFMPCRVDQIADDPIG